MRGFDACTHYVRSPASHDPRVAWIFDGLDPDAVIGDFGILQGGAAGYEIDRHDITPLMQPRKEGSAIAAVLRHRICMTQSVTEDITLHEGTLAAAIRARTAF